MKLSTFINTFLTLAAIGTPTNVAFVSNFGVQWKEGPLRQIHVDTSELIEEALATSKKYGASSPQARLAWEVVEEINASDNTAATLGTASDYKSQVQQKVTKLKEQQPAMIALNKMAAEIEAIKLVTPKPAPAEKNAKLQEAVKEAKRLTYAFGVHSSDAKVAWEIVEEIASSGRIENAMGGMLTPEECLIDAASEACAALEELNRVLNLQEQPELGKSKSML